MRLILLLIVAIGACVDRDDAFDAATPQHDAWVTCMLRTALPLITSKIDRDAMAAAERKRLWGVVAAQVADERS